MGEVFVGTQQYSLMSDAQLCDERVDRTQLHTRPAACASEARCSDVVFPIWLNQSERGKALHDLLARLGPGEALKKLLQDEASGDNDIRSGKSVLQRPHLWFFSLRIAS